MKGEKHRGKLRPGRPWHHSPSDRVPLRVDPRRVLQGSGLGRWGRRWRSRESQRRRRRCGPGPDTALRPRGSRPRVGARAEVLRGRGRAGQVLGLRFEVRAGTDAGTDAATDAGTHLGQMLRGQMQRGQMRGRTRGRTRGQMRRQMHWGLTHRARTGRGRLVQRHWTGPPRAVAAPAPWAGLTGCAAGGDCSQGPGSSRRGRDGGFELLGRRPAGGGGGGGGTHSRDLPWVPTRPRAPAAPRALGNLPVPFGHAAGVGGGRHTDRGQRPRCSGALRGATKAPQSPTMGQRSISSSHTGWVPPWPPRPTAALIGPWGGGHVSHPALHRRLWGASPEPLPG